jgi:hypothetical protein
MYTRSGAGTTVAAIAGSRTTSTGVTDESESSISISEGMLGYNRKMGEDEQLETKRGLDGPYWELPQLHLHYIWPRRKPHMLIVRAYGLLGWALRKKPAQPGPWARAHGPYLRITAKR